MQAIVAVDRNWAIGCGGRLLVSIPADHKLFRKTTEGRVLIYGRKTLTTFPMEQPLPGRRNIILSSDPSLQIRGAEVLHSVKELREATGDIAPDELMVIGGASVYRQLLPACDVVHVTKIDAAYQADAWFPDLDADPSWEVVWESEEQTYFDVPYTFMRYARRK